MLDVKTSEIVSMVSLPDYDPNINKVKKNRPCSIWRPKAYMNRVRS